MYKVKYSNQAQIDLEDAISYIAKQSFANALNYLQNYEKKIKLLLSTPYMGVECKTKLIKRECRVLVHESHIIIYKVNEKTENIFLIRIYHGSVDYAGKFNARTLND